MDKINLENLGKVDGRYFILISPEDIDLDSIDRVLNENNVITGLVGGYSYLYKEPNFVSILLKADEDTVIHMERLNSKVKDNIYVCDYSNYVNLISRASRKEDSDFSECSELRTGTMYGYNDMKVLMNKVGEEVNIVILIPFIGNELTVNRMTDAFVSMYSAIYKYIPRKCDTENSMLSNISAKYVVSYESLSKHSRSTFDMMMNYLLSILSVDKYAIMESLSSSDYVKSLLK